MADEPTVQHQPAQGPFHHPAALDQVEAFELGVSVDHFGIDTDGRCVLHELGLEAGVYPVDRIQQLWLRDLAKRWIRIRILAGRSTPHSAPASTQSPASGQFLTATDIDRLAEVDRQLLERHLA